VTERAVLRDATFFLAFRFVFFGTATSRRAPRTAFSAVPVAAFATECAASAARDVAPSVAPATVSTAAVMMLFFAMGSPRPLQD